MNRRSVLKSVAAGTAACTLAGCTNRAGDGTGAAEGGPVTLWHSLPDGERRTFDAAVEAFADDNSGSIRTEAVDDLPERTRTEFATGGGAELFLWDHEWVDNYSERGYLSDQREELPVSLDDYVGAIGEAVTYDGAVVGLPYAAETVALVYNETLVDEPPETFADMRSIMEAHHDPDAGTYGLTTPLDPYGLSAWAHAFGGYYFDADAESLGLTSEGTIRGFEFVLDNLVPYLPEVQRYGPPESAFVDGNAPLTIRPPWFVDDLDFDAGVAPFPTVDGSVPAPYASVDVVYFTAAMAGDEGRATTARRFAEWFTTDGEALDELASEHGLVPVHQSVLDESNSRLPDDVRGYAGAVEQGTPIPSHPKMDAVWNPLQEAVANVLYDGADLETAMEEAESAIRSRW